MISLLIEAALRTLLVALAVAGGLRLLRVSNVLVQKRAWCLVLAAALVMPLLMRWQWLSAFAPIRVPMHDWAHPVDSWPAAAPPASSTPPATTTLESPQTLRFAPQPVENSAAPAAARSGELEPAVVPQATRILLQPLALVWLLYLCVGAVLLARLLYGIGAAVRLWATAEPVCLTPEHDLTAGLRLRSSSRIASPVAVGSGIVLPADYPQWGRQKLRIVLAHERSHLRQGDFYLQALAGLHAVLFWFSPLAWWLKRKLSDLGEAVSDRAGLEVAASRSSYAQILLEFAALPRSTLIGVAMARSSRISHRMERVLNEPSFRLAFTGSRRRALLAVMLVPAAIFASTALIRVEAAAPQSPAQIPTSAIPDVAPSTAPVPSVNPTPLVPPTPVPSTSMVAPEPGSVATAAEALQTAQDQLESANRRIQSGLVPASERQDSYAVISPNREGMSFSGTWDDLTSQQIETARKQAKGEFLWFTHQGKAYILDDPAAIAQIESLIRSMEELDKQQKEMERQQKELGKQQEELARKMKDATFHTPDMSKEIAELEKQLAKLKAMQGKAMTAEEWAEMESKLGNLQGKLGSIEGGIASSQGALGGAMGKLGSLQGELGGKQGMLGAEQGKTWQQFDRTVRAIIDGALKEGKARPVE
ncbi:MAG: M56 family metallopeptidase [Terracidiphilus sp.]|jgi:beta-lactamase regulating signal transducer with metallopeptidase domain